ncbi:MAG: transposase [Clostridia bacterium]|nr:transposase [Clostridia bacterium]
MKNKPSRKANRLKNYDYSTKGDYFITICTHERKNIFWMSDYKSTNVKNYIELLNDNGKIVDKVLNKANDVYAEKAVIEKYVIMPDHIHILISILYDHIVSVDMIVKNIKKYASIETGIKELWQKGFYDHVVRNENDYSEIWDYIDANPRKITNNIFMQ